MGVSQLLSVPYALNAAKADNVNNSDTSDTNELQDLNFSGDSLYITNGNSIYLGNYSNIWQQNGNDIYYNNGNVGIGTTIANQKLIVQSDPTVSSLDSAIFEVRNKDGQVVFAVYQEGVRVYVDDTGTKGLSTKGGFAVGGFNATKSLTNEYLRVTPDSVRVYIEENSGSKSISTKGGFAVGGFNATKTVPTDYFNISGSDSSGTINPSEARVLWYPLKEAFLAGHVLIESSDSVGQNSWATGFESKSIGDYSQALGYNTRAFGNNSTAIGNNANAEGNNSYAFGNYANTNAIGSYAIGSGAKANGQYSFAVGSIGVDSAGNATSPTTASGNYAYAFGMGSVASNQGAFAFGTQDTASSMYSLAMGYKTTASGNYSTSMGLLTTASGNYSTAMGVDNIASGYSSITMGVDNIASGFISTAMGSIDTASGDYSTAMGYSTTASGDYSTTIGRNTAASGIYSTAMGYSTTASGSYSIAMGDNTIASGDYSTAMGASNIANGFASTATGWQTLASGAASTTIGRNTTASGDYSTAMGYQTIAKPTESLVIGQYNDTTCSSGGMVIWHDSDPLFIIGNGNSNTSRNNAMTVLKNGNVGINTTTPSELLDVYGYSPNIEITNTAETEAGIIFDDFQDPTNQYAKILYNSGSNNHLNFYNHSTTPGLILYTNNNVDVNGLFRATGANWPGSGAGVEIAYNGTGYIQSYDRDAGTWQDLVLGANNVYPNADNASYLGLSSRRWKAVYAVNGTIQTSDRRMKKEIKNITYGLNTVMQLHPVSFYWKDKNLKGKNLGLIAQEVLKVVPEVVEVGNDKNKTLGMKYTSLIPILIKGMQEQEEKINKLENENTALKNENTEFNNSLNSLKAEVEQLKQILELKAEK